MKKTDEKHWKEGLKDLVRLPAAIIRPQVVSTALRKQTQIRAPSLEGLLTRVLLQNCWVYLLNKTHLDSNPTSVRVTAQQRYDLWSSAIQGTLRAPIKMTFFVSCLLVDKESQPISSGGMWRSRFVQWRKLCCKACPKSNTCSPLH